MQQPSSNVITIIQARMGSSRLPGKVLLDIGGQPMLARVFERARRAGRVRQTIVATTTDPGDDAIETYCREHGYPVFRGNVYDVLDRFYQAARQFKADVIVRLTADCPVIDPALIDLSLQEYFDRQVDFAATRLPPPWSRTYPIGLDIEVCSFAGLERAWKEASLPFEREHVMPFFYDQDGRFQLHILNHTTDLSDLRWTVDTPEDLEVLRRIYARFNDSDSFTWLDVLDLCQREPDLLQLNAAVHHKSGLDVDERMGKN